MKKLLAIILVTIAVFSLSACGAGANNGNDSGGDGGNTEPKGKVVQPISDGGSFDGSNYS